MLEQKTPGSCEPLTGGAGLSGEGSPKPLPQEVIPEACTRANYGGGGWGEHGVCGEGDGIAGRTYVKALRQEGPGGLEDRA